MPKLDVARLEAIGFFRYTRPEALDRLRHELSHASFAFATETRRAYHADAEDLAEGDVQNLLGKVAPFLRHEGVPIDVVYAEVRVPAHGHRPAGRGAAMLDADGWLDEDGPDPHVKTLRVSFAPGAPPCEVTEGRSEDAGDYFLVAGDRKIVIWDYADPHHDDEDDWSRSARVTIALLNELLSAHGSAERAYALYQGNDLTVVFATPEMARLLAAAAESPQERLHDGAGSSAV